MISQCKKAKAIILKKIFIFLKYLIKFADEFHQNNYIRNPKMSQNIFIMPEKGEQFI